MGHDYKSTIFLHVKVMCNGLQTENDKKREIVTIFTYYWPYRLHVIIGC